MMNVHLSGAMDRRNLLPQDGYAYLIDDTEGAFTWPEITASIAETVPWRLEVAPPLRPEDARPQDDGLVRRGGLYVQRHPPSGGTASAHYTIVARAGRAPLWRSIQLSSAQSLSQWRRQCRLAFR